MSTKIEWTDETWNPIVGCSHVSEGCRNCYAEGFSGRLWRMLDRDLGKDHAANTYADKRAETLDAYIGVMNLVDGKCIGWNGETRLIQHALEKPLHWKKPRKIFVCSMGDLFHESVPDEWIDMVFAVMASCSEHTFQILTKRPERMHAYYSRVSEKGPDAANLYQSKLIDFYSRHGVDLTYKHQVPTKPTPELRFIYDSANGVKE